MSEMDEETVAELVRSLRLAQTALDNGFKTVIENGASVDSPLAQEFFQILCRFRDSQSEFDQLVAQGSGTTRMQ